MYPSGNRKRTTSFTFYDTSITEKPTPVARFRKTSISNFNHQNIGLENTLNEVDIESKLIIQQILEERSKNNSNQFPSRDRKLSTCHLSVVPSLNGEEDSLKTSENDEEISCQNRKRSVSINLASLQSENQPNPQTIHLENTLIHSDIIKKYLARISVNNSLPPTGNIEYSLYDRNRKNKSLLTINSEDVHIPYYLRVQHPVVTSPSHPIIRYSQPRKKQALSPNMETVDDSVNLFRQLKNFDNLNQVARHMDSGLSKNKGFSGGLAKKEKSSSPNLIEKASVAEKNIASPSSFTSLEHYFGLTNPESINDKMTCIETNSIHPISF